MVGNDVEAGLGSKKRTTTSCSSDREPTLSPELRTLKKEIFGAMPQTPHYLPLQKYKSHVRDGMILGLEIAFIKISQEIQSLVDPEIFFLKNASIRTQLNQLEEMGYNVNKQRQRLDAMKTLATCDAASQDAAKKFEDEKNEHEIEVSQIQLITLLYEEEKQRYETLITNRKRKIEDLNNQAREALDEFAATAMSSW